MSVSDYTVKKIDFMDLSQKAKDAYWKAFKELHAEEPQDVGNKTEDREASKIISPHGRQRANGLGEVVITDGVAILPHS